MNQLQSVESLELGGHTNLQRNTSGINLTRGLKTPVPHHTNNLKS